MSDTRTLILETLENLGQNGLTRDEMIELQKLPLEHASRKSFGMSLKWLKEDGIVEQHNDRFYLCKPIDHPPKSPANGHSTAHENAQKIMLAPFQSGRAPKSVTVYTSPVEHEGVVSVVFIYRVGGQFRLPMSAGWQICTGPDIPKWNEYQETTRGVLTVRLIFADGRNIDIPTNSEYPITYVQGV